MKRLLLLLLAVSLLAAGCGGDDGGGAPSKSEFIGQADALCKDYNATSKELETEIESQTAEATKQNSLAPFAPTFTKGVTAATKLNTAWQKLTAPEGDEQVIADIKKGLNEQLALFVQAETAVKANDVTGFQKLNEDLTKLQTTQRTRAKDYGFEECGKQT